MVSSRPFRVRRGWRTPCQPAPSCVSFSGDTCALPCPHQNGYPTGNDGGFWGWGWVGKDKAILTVLCSVVMLPMFLSDESADRETKSRNLSL